MFTFILVHRFGSIHSHETNVGLAECESGLTHKLNFTFLRRQYNGQTYWDTLEAWGMVVGKSENTMLYTFFYQLTDSFHQLHQLKH